MSIEIPDSEPTVRISANHARLNYVLVRLFRSSITKATVGGQTVKFHANHPGDIIAAQYMAGERNLMLACTGLLREGDVVWDIGANVGHWSTVLASSVGAAGRVIAFEPNPNTERHLRKNFEINGLTNYQIVNQAVGDRDETGTLRMSGQDSDPLASLARDRPTARAIEIELRTPSTLIESDGIEFPNFVKVDVEGFEFQVVTGLVPLLGDRRIRAIMCECNPALLGVIGKTVEDIAAIFRAAGFAVQLLQRVSGPDIHLLGVRN